jgi:nucleotide-binding universal stress UspA family protein
MSDTTVEFKQILVPTDFGDAAVEAVDFAVGLARKHDATITLLHVYEVPVYPYSGLAIDADFITPIREAAMKELGRAFAALEQTGCKARSQLECGVVWRHVLAVAEAQKADLIVMGTHGRKGVMHALLGSVAEKVVRLSPIPVLTIRGAPTPKK